MNQWSNTGPHASREMQQPVNWLDSLTYIERSDGYCTLLERMKNHFRYKKNKCRCECYVSGCLWFLWDLKLATITTTSYLVVNAAQFKLCHNWYKVFKTNNISQMSRSNESTYSPLVSNVNFCNFHWWLHAYSVKIHLKRLYLVKSYETFARITSNSECMLLFV